MDLYEAIEIICDDYCKYPDIESGNKLADICDKCPMNRCEDLRWADRKTEMVEPQMETWTKEMHDAFYTFLLNVINSNELEEYIGMFESKGIATDGRE